MNLEKDPSDHELMALIAGGDDEAFRQLVERYQREVYGTIVRMIGDATEAEDLAQQVFIRIYRASGRYQPTAQFRTWMFTILRNLVFNESQRRGRSKIVPLTEPDEDSGMTREWPDAKQRNPGEETSGKERLQRIDLAIQELPSAQKMAVLLKIHQDMSYEEIARVLKASVSATKSLLFRARETLKVKLSSMLNE